MTTFSTAHALLGVVLIALVSQALGHSYLTNPISRSNQRQTTTGCRGPNCLGPCDRSRAATTRAPIQIQRGASISAEWPRNNHAGGFIRFAWAPTASSDNHTAFDNGVQKITCHEVGGCKPDSASNPNGGDSAPADGSFQPCKTSLTVPLHLTNGAWTLQWAWYGGAFALGDYYSCVDYTITGGPTGAAAAPVFQGGDYSNPGQQKCKYFNTDRLHRCVNEPCNNPVYTLNQARSGAPFMTGNAVTQAPTTQPPTQSPPTQSPPTQSPPTQSPPTQSPPTQSPPTSPPSNNGGGSATCTPATVGRMKCTGASTFQTCTPGRDSATWSENQSCASGLFCNASGDFIHCLPSQSGSQTPPPSSGSCTLGQQQCSGNGYKTCGYGVNGGTAWSATQACQAGLSCHASGNSVYCY